ncbi:alpha/beta fold hydrolase [Paenibacillaceae bacterium]|nr:alpha/beta fold hydrolase [Paenibacillaceae bacterium]
MPYVTRNHVKIYYEYLLSSTAPPSADTLLIIHGAGLELRSWDLIIPYLEQHYHILRYDLRGHGLSDRGTEQLSWELLFADTLFLVNSLGISTFYAAGHGAGSICVVLLGAYRPEMVLGITLHSIPLFFPKSTADKLTAHRKSLVDNHSMQRLADYIIPLITLYETDSPQIKMLYESFNKVAPATYLDLWDGFAAIHDDIFAQLKRNTRPVAIISGNLDPIYPPYLSGLQTAYIRNSQCMTILNASNMTFYDQPEETGRQMHHFFQNGNISPQSEDAFLQALHSELFEMLHGQPDTVPAKLLRVDLMGQFQVFVGGEKIIEGWNRRYAKQLLMYLILNPSVTREQLCDDLWGEVAAGKARHNLRMYLTHLRKLLQDEHNGFLSLDKGHIYMNGKIQCDLKTFIEQIDEALSEQNTHQKQLLCTRLFDVLHPGSLRTLNDDWILSLRSRLEDKLFTLSLFMSEHCSMQGALAEAIKYMEWAVHFQPDHEDLQVRIDNLYMKYNKQT